MASRPSSGHVVSSSPANLRNPQTLERTHSVNISLCSRMRSRIGQWFRTHTHTIQKRIRKIHVPKTIDYVKLSEKETVKRRYGRRRHTSRTARIRKLPNERPDESIGKPSQLPRRTERSTTSPKMTKSKTTSVNRLITGRRQRASTKHC